MTDPAGPDPVKEDTYRDRLTVRTNVGGSPITYALHVERRSAGSFLPVHSRDSLELDPRAISRREPYRDAGASRRRRPEVCRVDLVDLGEERHRVGGEQEVEVRER